MGDLASVACVPLLVESVEGSVEELGKGLGLVFWSLGAGSATSNREEYGGRRTVPLLSSFFAVGVSLAGRVLSAGGLSLAVLIRQRVLDDTSVHCVKSHIPLEDMISFRTA